MPVSLSVNREPLVSHAYSQDIPISVAIVTAFSKLGENVDEDKQRLLDFVDPDALGVLVQDADAPARIITQLWGYPVIIDSGSIRIFEQVTT